MMQTLNIEEQEILNLSKHVFLTLHWQVNAFILNG